MEFKGNEGEWKIKGESSSLIEIQSNNKNICYVYKLDSVISNSNAKLISKAPEMLKMLIKFNNINSIAREHINEDLFEDLAKLIKEATTI